MKVLLLGVGMQGKAALHDLAHSGVVDEVIAADRDIAALKNYWAQKLCMPGVVCEYVDAEDPASVGRLMARGVDVAVSLLPAACQTGVAVSALKHGVHLVYASYVTPAVKALHPEAVARNVTILPEFGMDPGLDLVCLGEAVRSMERVEEIRTYGAGFPDPSAADNPIRYKLTWNLEGVLKSYYRTARIIREGKVLEIKAADIFDREFIHELDIENLGRLEAFPNGDALKYLEVLGLERAGLRHMGRYVLRWPGHAAFWKKIAALHLLDDEPVLVDSVPVDRKRFLASALSPHLRYGDRESDVVVVRVEVMGREKGRKKRALFQVIDRRDLKTGFYAMNRTVGFTASAGALMIGGGRMTRRGVLSPVHDIPYAAFREALRKRNIQITQQFDEICEMG